LIIKGEQVYWAWAGNWGYYVDNEKRGSFGAWYAQTASLSITTGVNPPATATSSLLYAVWSNVCSSTHTASDTQVGICNL
jgi:hypothetical protein